jgi:anti-anti-sigma factor
MLVEHKTQPAEELAAYAAGLKAHNGSPAAPLLFTAAVQLDADRAVVVLRGELGLMSVGALVECFAGIAPAINRVVLDLAEFDFIECSGLHAIAAAAEAVAADGGLLSVCSPRPQSRRLFDLVNFEQTVAVHL